MVRRTDSGFGPLPPAAGDLARPLLSDDGETVVFTQLKARPEGDKTAYSS